MFYQWYELPMSDDQVRWRLGRVSGGIWLYVVWVRDQFWWRLARVWGRIWMYVVWVRWSGQMEVTGKCEGGRGGSRKLWVGGSNWCKQGRSPWSCDEVPIVGWVWEGGSPPPPIWKKIEIRVLVLDVFWSPPPSTLVVCRFHTKSVKYLPPYEAWTMLWCFKWWLPPPLPLPWWSWLLRPQLSLIGVIGHMWPLMLRQNEASNRKNRCKPAVTFLIIEELKYNSGMI